MQVASDDVLNKLALAELLLTGHEKMQEPQDLPGRYGRVMQALDHVLAAMQCPAVVAGGWAVWRYGYVGRVTQDVDIVLPADRIDEFLKVASVSGFQILVRAAGRWPKMLHRETDVQVDVLPEGERPGTEFKPAPTTIPSPQQLGAIGSRLAYIPLHALVELKLAAGRRKDVVDVLELLKRNSSELDVIRRHLSNCGAHYLGQFEDLVNESRLDESR